jgi:protein arginine kinase activator
MECQNCSGKPATVFMTNLVEGKVQRTDLCAECAKQEGAMHPSGFLEKKPVSEEFNEGVNLIEKCPACGYPPGQLQKTGRMGCAVCYVQFSSFLQVALAEAQKGLVHQGKRPNRRSASPEVWRAEMEHLVATENYEAAALLRDSISKADGEKKGKPASS